MKKSIKITILVSILSLFILSGCSNQIFSDNSNDLEQQLNEVCSGYKIQAIPTCLDAVSNPGVTIMKIQVVNTGYKDVVFLTVEFDWTGPTETNTAGEALTHEWDNLELKNGESEEILVGYQNANIGYINGFIVYPEGCKTQGSEITRIEGPSC